MWHMGHEKVVSFGANPDYGVPQRLQLRGDTGLAGTANVLKIFYVRIPTVEICSPVSHSQGQKYGPQASSAERHRCCLHLQTSLKV